MRASTTLQNEIVRKLGEHFAEVKKEWDISKGATDIFSRSSGVYAPRSDVAVGPFNIEDGNKAAEIKRVFNREAPPKLKNHISARRLCTNENPRCALAIEIAHSGSSKHMLGDITNASMMGLYGFVVASSTTLVKLERIFKYVQAIKSVHKAPMNLFSNVCVILDDDFLRLLQSTQPRV